MADKLFACTSFFASVVIIFFSYSAIAMAVEGGVGFYMLGQRHAQAAVLPPPGIFVQFEEYFYNGEISSSEAIAENGKLDVGVEADVALSMLTGIWTPVIEVSGARPMVTLTLPFGYQKITADAEFTIGGIKLRDRFSEDVFTYGDPVLGLSLGWNRANWHWTVNGALNIPIGDYDETTATDFAFNRWGFDVTGAVTYFDPVSGWDYSLAAGITLNGENDKTDYDSGNELHIEAGVFKSFENGWKIGLAGYHYDQVSDDSGSAAPADGFKGKVSAIGPAFSYAANIKGIPIGLNARWYHEFNADNRTEGDAVFLGLSIPLAVFD